MRTKVPGHLLATAEEELARLCALFPLGYVPELQWRPYRVTAGMAYYRLHAIGLSTRVLKDEAAVRETLGHEYAHLLAVARHGTKAANHGPLWQRAMIDLGLEPKVRHTYDVERNRPRQRVTYRCLGCGASIVRSRRLPTKRRYVHVPCGGDLRLESVAPAQE
ncbi:MAG: SprT-like domain-containing protein [Fimbriimonas sp.]